MKKFESILLVDDDPVSNYMTSYYLTKSAICNQVSISRNGLEALDYLKNNCPDLILLDVHMPVMDGIEFLQTILQQGFNLHKTPVVFYTISSKDIEREKEKYGIGIIDKPLTVEKFFSAVSESYQLVR